MLLGTLGASLLGNLLTGKRIYRARKGKGVVRAGYGNNNKMDFQFRPTFNKHWNTKIYKNEPRFNGVFPKIIYPK